MSEQTDQTEGDIVTGLDVIDGVLTFRRHDGSTETYVPAVLGTDVAGIVADDTDGVVITGNVGFYGHAAGAQHAAIANATDPASVITQLNLLLAAARANGFIAT